MPAPTPRQAATIYRGYDITPADGGGYVWQDERNFVHWEEGVTKTPFATEEHVQADVDAYIRRRRANQAAA